MKDLLLTSVGDLDVSAFDLHLVDGALRVGQQVQVTLRAFLGEYDFDLGFGVPWRQRILGVMPANPRDAQDVVQAAILGVLDVTGINAFSGTFDRGTRGLSLSAGLDTSFGPVAVTGSFP